MDPKDEPKVQADAFGMERTPDGAPVVPQAPKTEEKSKPEEKPAEAPAPKTEDIDTNPVVKGLRDTIEKLEKDKASMGGNLSEQRKAIDAMKKEIADIKSGKSNGVEPLFKDIKRVKDLSKEERDAMSDNEKRLMDQLADTQEAMNKTVADLHARSTQEQTAAEKAAAEAAEKTAAEEAEAAAAAEFDTNVQTEALRLAGDDKDMANKIIAEFNEFAGNDELSDKARNERLAKAAKLVDGYTPPKEQRSPRGSAAGAADGDDKYGTAAIIDQVQKARTGGTYAL